ncbi:Uncharacterised protein [Enterobacter ludwigii]|nr:Uncharacterised protein [Enterobacter ludwigii]
MAGQHFTFHQRDLAKTRFGPAIQLLKLRDVRFSGRFQRGFIFWVGFHQPVENILRVQRPVRRAVPGVRVSDGFALFFEGMRLHTTRRHHQLAFEPGGFHQAIQPPFQSQTIDHHNICLA